MCSSRSRIVCLAGLLLLGCSGGDQNPPPPSEAGASSGPTLIGEWTTSNAPELAGSATTMRFSESGEYFTSGPMTVAGKPLTYKDESGTERIAPFQGSGTWKRDGDRLTVHVTQGNTQGFKAEPTTFRVVSLSERQLVLEQGGGTILTLFRVEGRTVK